MPRRTTRSMARNHPGGSNAPSTTTPWLQDYVVEELQRTTRSSSSSRRTRSDSAGTAPTPPPPRLVQILNRRGNFWSFPAGSPWETEPDQGIEHAGTQGAKLMVSDGEYSIAIELTPECLRGIYRDACLPSPPSANNVFGSYARGSLGAITDYRLIHRSGRASTTTPTSLVLRVNQWEAKPALQGIVLGGAGAGPGGRAALRMRIIQPIEENLTVRRAMDSRVVLGSVEEVYANPHLMDEILGLAAMADLDEDDDEEEDGTQPNPTQGDGEESGTEEGAALGMEEEDATDNGDGQATTRAGDDEASHDEADPEDDAEEGDVPLTQDNLETQPPQHGIPKHPETSSPSKEVSNHDEADPDDDAEEEDVPLTQDNLETQPPQHSKPKHPEYDSDAIKELEKEEEEADGDEQMLLTQPPGNDERADSPPKPASARKRKQPPAPTDTHQDGEATRILETTGSTPSKPRAPPPAGTSTPAASTATGDASWTSPAAVQDVRLVARDDDTISMCTAGTATIPGTTTPGAPAVGTSSSAGARPTAAMHARTTGPSSAMSHYSHGSVGSASAGSSASRLRKLRLPVSYWEYLKEKLAETEPVADTHRTANSTAPEDAMVVGGEPGLLITFPLDPRPRKLLKRGGLSRWLQKHLS